jgi:phytoene dehydrogenase-like protein
MSGSTEYSSEQPVIIVGAGLSGLACALALQAEKIPYLLLEAHAHVGGRVRSEEKNGFILDHGFQVYLTAYPEAGKLLDLDALALQCFSPGAIIRLPKQQTTIISDPLREPLNAFKTLFSSALNLGDKWHMLGLKTRLAAKSIDAIWTSPELTTREYLRQQGFSEKGIQQFFTPFFSGIFLEPHLDTSSRLFEFVFKHFSRGHAALPKHGMQAIPEQLAKRLKPEALKRQTRVAQLTLEPQPSVTLDNGEVLYASHIVLATAAPEAQRLLPQLTLPPSNRVSTLYFAAPRSPLSQPSLWLNAAPEEGPINHLCVPSDIQPSYAPESKALISATLLSEVDSERLHQAEQQLHRVFGPQVKQWTLLQSDTITAALPRFTPEQYPLAPKSPVLSSNLTLCGDYCVSPSIEGAIVSGQQAAQKVVHDLQEQALSSMAV